MDGRWQTADDGLWSMVIRKLVYNSARRSPQEYLYRWRCPASIRVVLPFECALSFTLSCIARRKCLTGCSRQEAVVSYCRLLTASLLPDTFSAHMYWTRQAQSAPEHRRWR